MTKHLLSSADLTPHGRRGHLGHSPRRCDVQRREVKKLPTLRGRTIINFFFEDSTRTRSSFEIAGKWMSADTINLSAKGSSTSKGSRCATASRPSTRWLSTHSSSGTTRAAPASRWPGGSMRASSMPVTARMTPTQALLDAYTLRSRVGQLDGRHVAIVGDLTHSRVFRSNVITLAAWARG